MMSSLLDNPGIVGGIVGGLFTLLVFSILFMSRAKFLKGSRWGMNFSEVTCPECGKPLPRVRTPKNARQFWWGGWTCENCGGEFDKWLKPMESNLKAEDERVVKKQNGEQAGTGQPATRPVFEPQGSEHPQPEAEGRSR